MLENVRTERFWESVEKTPTCWMWVKLRSPKGYGIFRVVINGNKRNRFAHRLSFEMANGPIPDGLLVDHMCHVKACVNPDHLRLVTNKQNLENRDGPQRNSKTGVRGVFINRAGNFYARVKHHQVIYSLGTFRSLKDAESAVIAKRNELFTHNDLDRIRTVN